MAKAKSSSNKSINRYSINYPSPFRPAKLGEGASLREAGTSPAPPG